MRGGLAGCELERTDVCGWGDVVRDLCCCGEKEEDEEEEEER